MSSAPGVVIREATPDDARAIAEVHVAAWRWAYRDDLPGGVPGRAHGGRARARVERVAHTRRRAPARWSPRRTASSSASAASDPSRDDGAAERTAEVLTIYLLEDVAGRGIGRELFASATDRLRALGYAPGDALGHGVERPFPPLLRAGGLVLGRHDQRSPVRLRERPDRPVRRRPVTTARPYRVRT